VREVSVKTERKTQVVDITVSVREALGEKADGAAVLVYVPHTTAGVTINEHADPNLARDLEMSLERIVEDGWPFKHLEPGDENASSHIRTALIGPQVVVPLDGGKLALGTWQGIFFCEFDGPRSRKVLVSVLR
jgi:secondary thiamine-phosphate synthase enzyme